MLGSSMRQGRTNRYYKKRIQATDYPPVYLSPDNAVECPAREVHGATIFWNVLDHIALRTGGWSRWTRRVTPGPVASTCQHYNTPRISIIQFLTTSTSIHLGKIKDRPSAYYTPWKRKRGVVWAVPVMSPLSCHRGLMGGTTIGVEGKANMHFHQRNASSKCCVAVSRSLNGSPDFAVERTPSF